MKILITGATGFLGSNLLRRLVSMGNEVVALVRKQSNLSRISDVKNFDKHVFVDYEFNDLFAKGFDLVVHCATDYGRKHVDPMHLINANLVLPVNLLNACIDHNVPSFINTDTILDKGVSTYSMSKKQFIDWLCLYSKELDISNIALEHFYGPGDDNSKFVTNVIRSLLVNQSSIDLTLGEQTRDFIYIEDVVDAFIKIIESPKNKPGFETYEVGTGECNSIRDFVMLARELCNSRSKINFGAVPYRENECMKYQADVEKLLGLGWRPQHDLKSGLNLTIIEERKLVNQ